MSTDFIVATKTRVDSFRDTVSLGDVVSYRFDCRPWQDDNSAITSATWTVESGQASVSGQSVSSGLVSALVTFSQEGKSLISILLNTATQKKKLWLEVYAKDKPMYDGDDYGISG